MDYRADIRIELKPGAIDAEGETVQKSLRLLGYDVAAVESVKVYVVTIEAESKEEARKRLDDACRRLLANPVIQNYVIEIK